jgi:hypothetical protein
VGSADDASAADGAPAEDARVVAGCGDTSVRIRALAAGEGPATAPVVVAIPGGWLAAYALQPAGTALYTVEAIRLDAEGRPAAPPQVVVETSWARDPLLAAIPGGALIVFSHGPGALGASVSIARLDGDARPTAAPVLVATPAHTPALAWSGTHALVVWTASDLDATSIRSTRVTADVVVEPSRELARADAHDPDVAWTGVEWVTTWKVDAARFNGVAIRPVAPTGVPSAPEDQLTFATTATSAAIAWADTHAVLVAPAPELAVLRVLEMPMAIRLAPAASGPSAIATVAGERVLAIGGGQAWLVDRISPAAPLAAVAPTAASVAVSGEVAAVGELIDEAPHVRLLCLR